MIFLKKKFLIKIMVMPELYELKIITLMVMKKHILIHATTKRYMGSLPSVF